MPTLKYDRNATGLGTGGSWVHAISDPARLMNDQLSGGGGETRRHEFAMGDNPWPFTANKTEEEGSARLEIVGVDPGNGSRQKPRFTCYEPHPTITGFSEVNPNWICYPNKVNGGAAAVVSQPGSNVWYRSSGPDRWAGAFRVSGELRWGRRCRVDRSSGVGALANAPSANYEYGDVASGANGPGGFVIYWDGAGDPSSLTYLRRPAGVTDTDVWIVDRPMGGFEAANLEFFESDFPLNVQNQTANSLVPDVWIHDVDFRYCRKGFSPIGNRFHFMQGGVDRRTGAGFQGLIFERNKGFKLGQMLFHTWGSACMNGAHVRHNRSRHNNQNEGSGTFYFDSSYTTDGSRAQCYQNWVHRAEYDGRYWLDGSAFYSEFGSANTEYWGNLVTETEVGVHLNIGQGSQWFHHNVMRSISSGTNPEAAVRIVSAALTTGIVTLGDAHVYANLADRFGMFIGVISFDFTGTAADRTRFYVHRNIARGRRSLDSNFLYPMQGNDGWFANARLWAYKNNYTDFFGTTVSASEYNGADTLLDAPASTTRVSDTAVMAAIPTPTDDDNLEIDYAIQAPTDIGTLNGTTTALRAGKQSLALAA